MLKHFSLFGKRFKFYSPGLKSILIYPLQKEVHQRPDRKWVGLSVIRSLFFVFESWSRSIHELMILITKIRPWMFFICLSADSGTLTMFINVHRQHFNCLLQQQHFSLATWSGRWEDAEPNVYMSSSSYMSLKDWAQTGLQLSSEETKLRGQYKSSRWSVFSHNSTWNSFRLSSIWWSSF